MSNHEGHIMSTVSTDNLNRQTNHRYMRNIATQQLPRPGSNIANIGTMPIAPVKIGITESIPQSQLAMPLFNAREPLADTVTPSVNPPVERPKAAPEETVLIHTDGACVGNPGPGGFAAIIERPGSETLIITGGDPDTTNNRMELAAVIEALKALNQDETIPTTNITVRSDSQYVCHAFNQNWIGNWRTNGWRNSKGQPVANMDLWTKLLAEIKNLEITWVWIPGHTGDPMNERCDRLAVSCSQQAHLRKQYWVSAVKPAGQLEKEANSNRIGHARTLNSDAKKEVELALELLEKGEAQNAREAMETALRTLYNQDDAIAKLERQVRHGARGEHRIY